MDIEKLKILLDVLEEYRVRKFRSPDGIEIELDLAPPPVAPTTEQPLEPYEPVAPDPNPYKNPKLWGGGIAPSFPGAE